MDSAPQPQQDATWVLFNCSCTTALSLPGPSGDLCTKEVLLFYNLRFQNSFSSPSMRISVTFALLLAWKCISDRIRPRKLKERDDATADEFPPKSYILSPSYHYSILMYWTHHFADLSLLKEGQLSAAAPGGLSPFLQALFFYDE